MVMHTYETQQKRAADFMGEVWKMLQCHLPMCRMLSLVTQETLKRDWENVINILY